MNDNEVISADDWTTNWQANIAIKITAMVLWVVILVAFLLLITITLNTEQVLRTQYSSQMDNLHNEVSVYLSNEKSPTVEKLLAHIKNEMLILPFSAFELSASNTLHLVGDIPQHHVSSTLQLNLPLALHYNGNSTGTLTVFHQSLHMAAIKHNLNLIIAVAISVMIFGLFLTWIIHHVLSKPFKALINATKIVSEGNLDTRISLNGQDEFAQLSRFFNEMLDQICAQQKDLVAGNKELQRENTVRLDAERALLLQQQHLEKLVAERTSELAVAHDQALLSNHSKSAFIANMSHEIRTPLTAIIGFAEFILDKSQSESEKHEAVATVIRNGQHLLTIINDILDMSKMEAGKLDVEKISISPFQIMSDIESLVGMQARDKGLDFSVNYQFPLPTMISSDPTRLKQILLNLSTNAVKFTAHGSVHVTVECDVESQSMGFTVIDSGIGLSASAQERLFKAFSQADSSTTREFGGTGLGLFISKCLAQMLGGDISVESIEGSGSKFKVSINTGSLINAKFIEQTSAIENNIPITAIQDTKLSLCGKILLAEDSPDNQRLIKMYISKAGEIDVTIVENGSLAVEHALSNDYDFVLMDMQMPVMDGMEAVSILRASGYSRPIIALTANAMIEDQQKYLAAGCDGFLSKPIDKHAFFSTLSERLYSASHVKIEKDDLADAYDIKFQQLVDKYIISLPTHRDELDKAISNKQWDLAKNVAHKLKGTGGSFGFPDISHLAAPLENALTKNELDNVSYYCEALLKEIDRVTTQASIIQI